MFEIDAMFTKLICGMRNEKEEIDFSVVLCTSSGLGNSHERSSRAAIDRQDNC
jgi:hypothetical protein